MENNARLFDHRRTFLLAETMRCIFKVLACLVLLGGPASAGSEFGTREEAVAMVKRVQAKFAKDGADATFAAVSDQSVREFHDRDLYAFVIDFKGLTVAHGARPALIGKSMMALKDPDGRYFIQEMISVAREQGSGWVSYKWPHPLTNKIEDKTSYIETMGDYVVGVGVRP